jgi:hypothetical protein
MEAGTRLIPDDILELFGPPLLWPGEDPASYMSLLSRIAAELQPTDVFGWLLVRDRTDLSWEYLRNQRHQITALQMKYDEIKNSRIAALEHEIENSPDRERRQALQLKLDDIQSIGARIAKVEQIIENTPAVDYHTRHRRRYLERCLEGLKERARGYDTLMEDGLKQQLAAWHTENNRRVAEITPKLEQVRAQETTGGEFASTISSFHEEHATFTQRVAEANAQLARLDSEIAKHSTGLGRDLRDQVGSRSRRVEPVRLNDLIELLGPPALMSYQDEGRYRKLLGRTLADLGRSDTRGYMTARRFVDARWLVDLYRGLIADLVGQTVEAELNETHKMVDKVALRRLFVESTLIKPSPENEQGLKRAQQEHAVQERRIEKFKRQPPTVNDIINALRRCMDDVESLERFLRHARRELSAMRAEISSSSGHVGIRHEEVIDGEVLPPVKGENRSPEAPQLQHGTERRGRGAASILPGGRPRSRIRRRASAPSAKALQQRRIRAVRK